MPDFNNLGIVIIWLFVMCTWVNNVVSGTYEHISLFHFWPAKSLLSQFIKYARAFSGYNDFLVSGQLATSWRSSRSCSQKRSICFLVCPNLLKYVLCATIHYPTTNLLLVASLQFIYLFIGSWRRLLSGTFYIVYYRVVPIKMLNWIVRL